MAIREAQRDRVVERLGEHLLTTGLSQVSLRQLAAAAGVSDRMLLYYFADKTEVIAASLEQVAAGMIKGLADVLPPGETYAPAAFVLKALSITAHPQMRGFMRLWIELIAAAGRGEAPYAEITGRILAGFKDWVAQRIIPPPGVDAGAMAVAILAVIDGLALIDVAAPGDVDAAAIQALSALLGGAQS